MVYDPFASDSIVEIVFFGKKRQYNGVNFYVKRVIAFRLSSSET